MDDERKGKIKLNGIRRIGALDNRTDNASTTRNSQKGLKSQQMVETDTHKRDLGLQDQSGRSETMIYTTRTAQTDQPAVSSIQSETKVNNKNEKDRTVVHSADTHQNILPTTLNDMPTTDSKHTMTPWERDRINGARVYKIVGYTTVDKINRKFYAERQQRFVRKLLTTVLVIAIIVLLILKINPIKDPSDFRRILGLDSWYNDNQQPEKIELPEDPLSTTETHNP